MKTFMILVLFMFATTGEAAVKRYFQDAHFPSQATLEMQAFGTPAAAGTNEVLDGVDGATSAAAATVSTFAAQPDVPRNLVITPGGSTAAVGACTIVVNGTNIKGAAISENFAFLENASSATTGAKAFKTVTSVVFPANCETDAFAATWSIGYGEKIGLKNCMDAVGYWAWSTVSGAYESTRATVVVDADEVEKNTADFNGTMNDTAPFVGFFVQNFRCL